MKLPIVPGDVPLPLPTGGLEYLLYFFQALLVVSWVVHILFINVLLGASLASVYFDSRGYKEGKPVLDRVAYLLTTPVTISENMGALWGVAPLLLVSVLYTPLFYSAAIMNSPHWLHIIYGNIVAFLCSYLYKFTWKTLKDRKPLHIMLGAISVILFFSLPPVFMATVQLYMTPTTWTHDTHFWQALMRPDTLFRLAHFYLASFAVTGIFMLVYGSYKRRSAEALDRDAGAMLVRTGKSWFIVATVLNFFVGPLVLFHFPTYGIEAFFAAGYHWLIVLTVILSIWAIWRLVTEFFSDDVTPRTAWTIALVMLVAVISMATLRHGMRLSLVTPTMQASIAKSEKFQAEAKEAYDASKLVTPAAAAPAEPAGKTLADKYGCLACHAEKERLVGPAYADVAKRDYCTVESISALVRQPKPANWPDIEAQMPPMTEVPDDELKQIADWICALK